MTFIIRALDGEEHTFNLSEIKEDPHEEDIREFIESELSITFFDISWEYPLGVDSVISVTGLCEGISEREKEKYFEFLEDIVIYHDIYKFAAYFGHLKCLSYAYENRHKDLSYGTHEGCLRYFEKDLEWDEDVIMIIATNGYLDCLKYAHENGCKWDEWICASAAEGGHLHCLIYAHEHGCEWDKETCESAAFGGYLYCLIYARKHGCEWDKEMCLRVSSNHSHIQEWIKNQE